MDNSFSSSDSLFDPKTPLNDFELSKLNKKIEKTIMKNELLKKENESVKSQFNQMILTNEKYNNCISEVKKLQIRVHELLSQNAELVERLRILSAAFEDEKNMYEKKIYESELMQDPYKKKYEGIIIDLKAQLNEKLEKQMKLEKIVSDSYMEKANLFDGITRILNQPVNSTKCVLNLITSIVEKQQKEILDMKREHQTQINNVHQRKNKWKKRFKDEKALKDNEIGRLNTLITEYKEESRELCELNKAKTNEISQLSKEIQKKKIINNRIFQSIHVFSDNTPNNKIIEYKRQIDTLENEVLHYKSINRNKKNIQLSVKHITICDIIEHVIVDESVISSNSEIEQIFPDQAENIERLKEKINQIKKERNVLRTEKAKLINEIRDYKTKVDTIQKEMNNPSLLNLEQCNIPKEIVMSLSRTEYKCIQDQVLDIITKMNANHQEVLEAINNENNNKVYKAEEKSKMIMSSICKIIPELTEANVTNELSAFVGKMKKSNDDLINDIKVLNSEMEKICKVHSIESVFSINEYIQELKRRLSSCKEKKLQYKGRIKEFISIHEENQLKSESLAKNHKKKYRKLTKENESLVKEISSLKQTNEDMRAKVQESFEKSSQIQETANGLQILFDKQVEQLKNQNEIMESLKAQNGHDDKENKKLMNKCEKMRKRIKEHSHQKEMNEKRHKDEKKELKDQIKAQFSEFEQKLKTNHQDLLQIIQSQRDTIQNQEILIDALKEDCHNKDILIQKLNILKNIEADEQKRQFLSRESKANAIFQLANTKLL